MWSNAQSETGDLPLGGSSDSVAGQRRLQFSVRALLLMVFVVAVACAALKWAGWVWLVPTALAALWLASIAAALRWGPNWRMLKPGVWHLAVWLCLATAASAMTSYGCLQYNEIAGTDKTPRHIARISAAALGGPLVGP